MARTKKTVAAEAVTEVNTTEVKAEETKAAKAPAKKTALKETVLMQWYGKEVNKDDLMKQVKEIWTKQLKKKVGEMKTVTIYLKPEENMAYYVINEEVTGNIAL